MTDIVYWHEWPSNFSNGTSVEGVGTLMQYTNSVVGGTFGVWILLVFATISFLALKAFNAGKAFAATAFATTIIAILLARIHLISIQWVILCVVMTVVGVLVARSESTSSL